MIEKVMVYDLRGTPGDWLTSYQHNRQQYYSLNGKKSKKRGVTCGIPHGSCKSSLVYGRISDVASRKQLVLLKFLATPKTIGSIDICLSHHIGSSPH